MDNQLPELTKEQWEFLAVLDAFGGPVRIEVAGTIAPLLPGPLFDLFGKTETQGWIQKVEDDRLVIGQNLPGSIQNILERMNSKERLAGIVDIIIDGKMRKKLGILEWLYLLKNSGRTKETAETEVELAHVVFNEGNQKEAYNYLKTAVTRLMASTDNHEICPLFLSATLDLSNTGFAVGRGFKDIETFLLKAQDIAGRLGDQRSHALLSLHIGRLYYFTDRRDNALIAMSMGFEEIEELGDDDIMLQSAVFLGLFHFIKGHFNEAVKHFEKAEQLFELKSTGIAINPTAPVFMGYCAAYLGQFHRAIGSLDFNWRLAEERSDQHLASTIRAVLGTVLLLMRKDREASIHLQQARDQAIQCNNALGLLFAGGGIGLQYFMAGNLEKAHEVLTQTVQEGARAGFIRQYSSPWVLEMGYEFYRLGFPPIPGFDFPKVIENIFEGVNIHLQGVALRLRAKDKAAKGEERYSIESDLAESERCLQESGDPVQLSKTILEMARLELSDGNQENARRLCQNARRLLGGYFEEFFPNEFRHLIALPEKTGQVYRNEEFLEKYLEMVESLYPSEDKDEILSKMLVATNRMFGAERSSLFWFPNGKLTPHHELRAVCNLTEKEVESEGFRKNLEMVHKAFETNQPQMKTAQKSGSMPTKHQSRSVLCIPVEMRGKVHGVLYFDNSYLDDAFNFIDPAIMKHMVRHTNQIIERKFNSLNIEKQKNILVFENSARMTRDTSGIIAQSQIMSTLLRQVDQIAPTESTVLILGETGTGKELFAKRIHQHSSRSEGPCIIVDSTTIPENLLESELFGHEQGAFTGAERRKIGRIETAHEGTLFLDEIGELPLSAQAKLLRALQERTFNRVGGTKTITSNFRLVAATNRKLEKEVAAGRFREDLFYRLNVIPINLPPLRDRGEDVLLLTDHFLSQYANRYKRPQIRLTAEQENMLNTYPWPGNIRELKNVMERAVLLSGDQQLELNLPFDIQEDSDHPFEDCPSLDEIQRRYIRFVLKKTGGKIGGAGGAAKVLGIKRTSLYTRMRNLRMK